MKMNFLSGNIILTFLLKLKIEKFGENFVTKEEYNLVKDVLQKKYDAEKLGVTITDAVDTNYFILQDVITPNNISINELENKYIKNIPNFVANILWNKDYVYNELVNNKNGEIMKKGK